MVVDVLEVTAGFGIEAGDAAVTVEGPRAGFQRAVALEGLQLTGRVVADRLPGDGRGGVGPLAAVGDGATGVLEEVAVVAVAVGEAAVLGVGLLRSALVGGGVHPIGRLRAPAITRGAGKLKETASGSNCE